ncbi:PD-(D/E)XK nuclease-like domain-containing protein [Brevibacillus laterosporus]
MIVLLELNDQNYYSLEADREYMSNSQYKDFRTCEAMAMAKLSGEWSNPSDINLLLGSYVHAWLEGTLEQFKENNPSLFTKKGELYAQYRHADQMIQTLQEDPFVMLALEGQKEVIATAEFADAPWKIKMDVYNPEQCRIADLKTVRDINGKYWDKSQGYVSFVEAYGYLRQMALYLEIERLWAGRDTWLEALIVAVSKEDPPDKAIIGSDTTRLGYELEEVVQHMPRILEVKHGFADPVRCEKCKYCRETKKIKHIVHYLDLLE